jgi:electron transport complex protein RnfA
MVKEILSFAFAAVFLNNIFFSGVFGGSTLILISNSKTASKSKGKSDGNRGSKKYTLGFCIALTALLTVCSALTYFTDGILADFAVGRYLRIPVYTALVGLVYIFSLVILSSIMSAKFDTVKKYIHTAAFNSAVFGCLLTAFSTELAGQSNLLSYALYGLCAGFGFSLAAVIAETVSKLLYSEHMPHSFRGYPAMLIFLGFMGMAFYSL